MKKTLVTLTLALSSCCLNPYRTETKDEHGNVRIIESLPETHLFYSRLTIYGNTEKEDSCQQMLMITHDNPKNESLILNDYDCDNIPERVQIGKTIAGDFQPETICIREGFPSVARICTSEELKKGYRRFSDYKMYLFR